VLPVFPYSRQPDVPYVRPDTPLANAPAMLFKDSFTVSSAPSTPGTGLVIPDWEKPNNASQTRRHPIDSQTASPHLTGRDVVPGGSGAAAGTLPLPSLFG
jgi:hypothetical protein